MCGAAHINVYEWTEGVKLCTLIDVIRSFENGEEAPGNLIVTRDLSVHQQLKLLWTAHDSKVPIKSKGLDSSFNLKSVASSVRKRQVQGKFLKYLEQPRPENDKPQPVKPH